MQFEITHLAHSLGITVVYVTHDQTEALTMSDLVAVFDDGRIQQLAPPDKLYEEPENSFVAQFIGENNTLEGVVKEISGDRALVELDDGELIDCKPVNVTSAGERIAVTLATIGLSQSHVPFRRAIMAIMISPMIVPLIISATGMFFFYSTIGNWMEGTLGLPKTFVGYVKVVLAHAVPGIPFVIITVTATLVGFDRSLTRAAANMGANPVTTFFKVQMPLILPEVISIALLTVVELLRRRSERLRGLSPG